eukprot:gene20915-43043_t
MRDTRCLTARRHCIEDVYWGAAPVLATDFAVTELWGERGESAARYLRGARVPRKVALAALRSPRPGGGPRRFVLYKQGTSTSEALGLVARLLRLSPRQAASLRSAGQKDARGVWQQQQRAGDAARGGKRGGK